MSTLVVTIDLPEGSLRPTRGQAVPRPSTKLTDVSFQPLLETKLKEPFLNSPSACRVCFHES